MRRIVFALLACLLLVLITGCTAPTTAKDSPPGDFPTNPFDKPVQPRPIGADPSVVNRSCKTDADCTVKNVGNCCGHYPACVNVNAQTNPEAVQAQCAKSGMASVCGFPQISGCKCVSGQCAADSQASAL
ncbi:hypothetical protein [Solilutibacter tolerans]|uniref:Secreted protein n=1 Tax=Solilutibacter tolerans TaxID=1604334 RepID=A0A1N6TSI0_9GAMM|nr:hypothetical protein SAMN05421546_1456 [Lysobacter tolerans]